MYINIYIHVIESQHIENWRNSISCWLPKGNECCSITATVPYFWGVKGGGGFIQYSHPMT